MKVNVNAAATVRLTEAGVEAHRKYWAGYGVRVPPLKAGEPFRTELWMLMETFGPSIGSGTELFVGNEVEIGEVGG